jgi:WD40 repeat protein
MEPIDCLVFSGDGKWLMTAGGWDHSARLWDVASGKQLRVFQARADEVISLSISDDGKRLATGSGGGGKYRPGARNAQVWDLAAGKQLQVFKGHTSSVRAVSLSPDGKRLLTGSEDDTVRLWDVATGREIRILKGRTARVTAVTLSRDGKWALSASGELGITGTSSVPEHEWEFSARLWSLDKGEKLRVFSHYRTNGVWAVALSPDNKWLVTGSSTKEVRVWDVSTGKKVRELKGHMRGVLSVVLSRDGRCLATGSEDRTARLWDFANGKEIHVLHGHRGPVHAVVLSRDGKWLATGAEDATARLWDVKTGKELRVFQGHTGALTAVTFAGDGRWLITASDDATTRIWDTRTGNELCRLVTFLDGSWVVLDVEGRYDATNPARIDGLHWVSGLQTIPLQHYRDRYYDPGLLAKHLGFHAQPPRTIGAGD